MPRIIEILLVEDSLSDRYLAIEALAEAKILNNVHTVDDGVQALEFVRRTGKYSQAPRPDLIFAGSQSSSQGWKKGLGRIEGGT